MILATKSVVNTDGMTSFDKDSSYLLDSFIDSRRSQIIRPHDQLMRHLLLLETWESLWDFGGHQQYPFISPIIPKGLRVPKFQPSESCSSYQSNEEILYPYVLTNRHLNQSFHASLILHDCCTIHSGSGEMHLDDLGSLGDQGRVGGRVCGLHWVADCRCFQACVKLLMMLMAR